MLCFSPQSLSVLAFLGVSWSSRSLSLPHFMLHRTPTFPPRPWDQEGPLGEGAGNWAEPEESWDLKWAELSFF